MSFFLSHFFNFRFSFFWGYIFALGFLIFGCLCIQFVSGSLLALVSNNNLFFLKSLHSSFASFIIFFTYVHIFKSVYYRTEQGATGKLALLSGFLVLLFLLFTAFSGYILPWGQVSYWGLKVTTTLLDIFPFYGCRLKECLWGFFCIDFSCIVPRFFSLHLISAGFLYLFVCLHLVFVHSKKSLILPLVSLEATFFTNYLYPSAYLKDFFLLSVFFFIVSFYFFFDFSFFNEFLNNVPVSFEKAPLDVCPEWYFLPSFASLKYCSSKVIGVFISGSLLFSFLFPFNSIEFYYYE